MPSDAFSKFKCSLYNSVNSRCYKLVTKYYFSRKLLAINATKLIFTKKTQYPRMIISIFEQNLHL